MNIGVSKNKTSIEKKLAIKKIAYNRNCTHGNFFQKLPGPHFLLRQYYKSYRTLILQKLQEINTFTNKMLITILFILQIKYFDFLDNFSRFFILFSRRFCLRNYIDKQEEAADTCMDLSFI